LNARPYAILDVRKLRAHEGAPAPAPVMESVMESVRQARSVW
jgi:hypothetical protein